MGPPGSGKGTQANLISEEIGAFHLNMGQFFRDLVKAGDPMMTPELIEQMNSGLLLDPRDFLSTLEVHIRTLVKDGKSLVFSGSPRNTLEAFGDKNLKGFMEILTELFGLENIYIFQLNISEQTTIERNTKRSMERGRADDKLEVIKVRLEQYKTITEPVFKALEEKGFNVIKIDGEVSPEEVFTQIKKHL